MNPFTGSSELFFSDEVDRIRARAAACTPLPAWSIWMSPASSRLSMSFAFTFRFTMILLASCLTCGSHDGFHCGFGTSVYCLFSWKLWNLYGPVEIGCSWYLVP